MQSNKGVIEAFKNRLEKNGINVTIRREMGRDIERCLWTASQEAYR